MRSKFFLAGWLSAVTLATSVSFAADPPFAGKFSDGNLTLELAQQASEYTGTITLGQQKFPAMANLDGSTLSGTFTSGGHSFPFNATLANDSVTLVTGHKTYTLQNSASPQNPLGDGGSQAASASATHAPPPGYDVTASTATGQSLLTHKANLKTIKDALESTFPELATFFGNQPTVAKAFQDAKDPKSGGATFTVTMNGQPMQGFIKCALDDSGATVAVIYGQASAPKSDWDQLLKSAPPAGGADSAPAAPSIPLKEDDFADGTGSIGLVDGWTTKTQSAADPIFIAGPATQALVINNGVLINLPDSMVVKNRDQMQQMMKQTEARREATAKQFEKMTGRPSPLSTPPPPPPPPPVPPLLVAPLLDPVDALKTMIPQFSALAQFNHGPATKIDQIISSKDIPCPLPNGKGAEILYEYTTADDGQPVQLRRLMRLNTAPMGSGTWFWYVTVGMAAPVGTFDHDLTLMQAMAQSVKINRDRLNEVMQQRNQQMQQAGQIMADATNKSMQIQHQMFLDNQQTSADIHSQQMQASADAFHAHNVQWSNQEWQKQRSAADFQEYVLGSRTVVDTQSGQAAQVDLSYANGVAQSLNDATLDPNRFVAVPLRDQLYPTPPPVGR